MLHQPEPDQAPDLLAGIIAIRKLHTRAISESGLTAADDDALSGEQKLPG